MANFDNNASQPLAKASAKGTVKWFNSTKGYGFITLEDGGDAFCHASALASLGTPNVPQGATVICDLQDSPRGLQVVAVHSIDTSTADPAPSQRPRPGGDRFGGNRSGGGDRHAGGDRYGGGDRFGGGERYGGDDRFSDRFGGGDRFSNNDRFGGGDRPRGGGEHFGGGRDAGPSGPMMDGKVKFFNDQKGFGFVMPDNGGGDVYCHASALRRSGLSALSPEQRIRFSTRQGTKGVEVDRIELI
ncbi:MAG: cold shock domain-containing protein [Rhizomicrobium sp.]|jgi:CspA family cold shock protein